MESTFDILIAIAYFAIPVEILFFQRHLPNGLTRGAYMVIFLFAAFILLCGTTHLFAFINDRYYVYPALLVSKGLTAVVSAMTAVVMLRIIPRTLALPAYAASLEHEVQERMQTEANLKQQMQNQRLTSIVNRFRGVLNRVEICNAAAADLTTFSKAVKCVIFLPPDPATVKETDATTPQKLDAIAEYTAPAGASAFGAEQLSPVSFPRLPIVKNGSYELLQEGDSSEDPLSDEKKTDSGPLSSESEADDSRKIHSKSVGAKRGHHHTKLKAAGDSFSSSDGSGSSENHSGKHGEPIPLRNMSPAGSFRSKTKYTRSRPQQLQTIVGSPFQSNEAIDIEGGQKPSNDHRVITIRDDVSSPSSPVLPLATNALDKLFLSLSSEVPSPAPVAAHPILTSNPTDPKQYQNVPPTAQPLMLAWRVATSAENDSTDALSSKAQSSASSTAPSPLYAPKPVHAPATPNQMPNASRRGGASIETGSSSSDKKGPPTNSRNTALLSVLNDVHKLRWRLLSDREIDAIFPELRDASGRSTATVLAVHIPQAEGVIMLHFASDEHLPDASVVESIANLSAQISVSLSYAAQWSLRRAKQKELARHNRRLQELSKKLDRANRAKSDFLCTVTHEIRNPLYPVIGLTELLLDTPLDPEQLDMVDNIRRSSDLLLSLVNDILDFSKFDGGHIKLESVLFELGTCVVDALELAASKATNPLSFSLEVGPGVPTRLVTDRLRFTQILLNFLSNAAKFTQKGEVVLSIQAVGKNCARPPHEPVVKRSHKHKGLKHLRSHKSSAKVVVEQPAVEIPSTTGDESPDSPMLSDGSDINVSASGLDLQPVELLVSIKDTGIGISPPALANLFKEFQQADTSTTRKFGGTGLGLALCRKMVQALGGEIWVESQVGSGSTFTFSLHCSAPKVAFTPDLVSLFASPENIEPANPSASRCPCTLDQPGWCIYGLLPADPNGQSRSIEAHVLEMAARQGQRDGSVVEMRLLPSVSSLLQQLQLQQTKRCRCTTNSPVPLIEHDEASRNTDDTLDLLTSQISAIRSPKHRHDSTHGDTDCSDSKAISDSCVRNASNRVMVVVDLDAVKAHDDVSALHSLLHFCNEAQHKHHGDASPTHLVDLLCVVVTAPDVLQHLDLSLSLFSVVLRKPLTVAALLSQIVTHNVAHNKLVSKQSGIGGDAEAVTRIFTTLSGGRGNPRPIQTQPRHRDTSQSRLSSADDDTASVSSFDSPNGVDREPVTYSSPSSQVRSLGLKSASNPRGGSRRGSGFNMRRLPNGSSNGGNTSESEEHFATSSRATVRRELDAEGRIRTSTRGPVPLIVDSGTPPPATPPISVAPTPQITGALSDLLPSALSPSIPAGAAVRPAGSNSPMEANLVPPSASVTPAPPRQVTPLIVPASPAIPFSGTTSKTASPGLGQNPQFAGIFVLMVEDNLVNQKLTGKYLDKLGVKFEVADNGQIALDMVKANPERHHVILMDLTMPVMDGITSCELIMQFLKDRSPTVPSEAADPSPSGPNKRKHKFPWVVAMSASTSDEITQRCLKAGMHDFLNKPTRLDGFENMFSRYLKTAPTLV